MRRTGPIFRMGMLAAGSGGLLFALGATALPAQAAPAGVMTPPGATVSLPPVQAAAATAQAASTPIRVRCDTQDLIDAINTANSTPATHDTLILAKRCTYALTTDVFSGFGGPNGLPPVTSPITITGNDTRIARVSTAPRFRILEVDAGGALVLDHLTISGGDRTGVNAFINRGGGIFNTGGTVALLYSAVTDNDATFGGGIDNFRGTVTLRSSKVTKNTATFSGGGIDNAGNVGAADLKVESSVIRGNSAGDGGGGIANFFSSTTTTLRDSIVVRNAAGAGSVFAGGGIGNFFGASVTLRDSEVTGNTSARRGGGISNENASTLTLRYSDVEDNTATGTGAQGGGIANIGAGSTVQLFGSDVEDNAATVAPGGIFNSVGTVTLARDSDVRDNRPTNCTPSAPPVAGCHN